MQAAPARTYDDVAATKNMIERTEETLGLKPDRLAETDSTGGAISHWVSSRKWRAAGGPVREGDPRRLRLAFSNRNAKRSLNSACKAMPGFATNTRDAEFERAIHDAIATGAGLKEIGQAAADVAFASRSMRRMEICGSPRAGSASPTVPCSCAAQHSGRNNGSS
ncbi:MAG TPA: hypothetical protein VLJ17_18845 [Xanthobacteraceae bacterium]|nr:hypothetical protein [Xanthobacteraceae bacterium]